MNKELFLALDFKNAPKSLQDAATAQYANLKALAKQQAKLDQATTDLANLKAAAQQGDEILRKELSAWTPVI